MEEKKTRKNRKGGGNDPVGRPKTATVVQFPPVGPQASSKTNANTASVNNNKMFVESNNNAARDYYAFNTEIPTIGGGKTRKTKKTRKSRKSRKTKKVKTTRRSMKTRRSRRAGKRGVKWGCYSGGFRGIRNSLRNIRSRLSNPYNYPIGSSGLSGTKLSGTATHL